MARQRSAPEIIARRGHLVVERDPRRPSGRLLRDDDTEASYVDLEDPTHLEFDYMRWMRLVLRAATARRVLHIGGAGCALPRALAAADPHGLQEVCEVDPEVLALAREHLALKRAPGLHVRNAEGRAFITAQPDSSWDAVVVDAFVGASVPPRLITEEAAHEFARLAPLALLNVVDSRSGRLVRTTAAALTGAYSLTWGLSGRDGNTLLAGAAAGHFLARTAPVQRIAAHAAADSSPPRLIPPAALARLAAGATALHDADVADGQTDPANA
jgi:hypothetical protein